MWPANSQHIFIYTWISMLEAINESNTNSVLHSSTYSLQANIFSYLHSSSSQSGLMFSSFKRTCLLHTMALPSYHSYTRMVGFLRPLLTHFCLQSSVISRELGPQSIWVWLEPKTRDPKKTGPEGKQKDSSSSTHQTGDIYCGKQQIYTNYLLGLHSCTALDQYIGKIEKTIFIFWCPHLQNLTPNVNHTV